MIEVYPTFALLLAAQRSAAVIAVDIPIGLSESAPRPADQAARRFLGPRGSSVFPAPCRPALGGASYAAASARSFAASGKRLSKQTFAIVPKIREVDRALRADAATAQRVVEVHPEVSFAVLNHDRPMPQSKKRAEGRAARRALLPKASQTALDAARPRWLQGQVTTDDLLDALVALWTAGRVLEGRARGFPPTPLVRDAFGLPMQIVA